MTLVARVLSAEDTSPRATDSSSRATIETKFIGQFNNSELCSLLLFLQKDNWVKAREL